MLKSAALVLLLLVGLSTAPGLRVSAQQSHWTTKKIKKSMPAYKEGGGVLREVSVAKHEGYDRVVFEFNDEIVPGYEVGYARPPFYLGETDHAAKVAGSAFIRMSLTPATHQDRNTVNESGETRKATLNSSVLKEIMNTYDFQGDVVYILGLSSRKPFRVQAMTKPARLVLDIKH